MLFVSVSVRLMATRQTSPPSHSYGLPPCISATALNICTGQVACSVFLGTVVRPGRGEKRQPHQLPQLRQIGDGSVLHRNPELHGSSLVERKSPRCRCWVSACPGAQVGILSILGTGLRLDHVKVPTDVAMVYFFVCWSILSLYTVACSNPLTQGGRPVHLIGS